jgi:hypothetical protein
VSDPVASPEEFVTVAQWAALVRAADALVHQTEAAAMQARSLQAQVAALGIGLEEAPAAELTGDPSPLTPAEIATARAVFSRGDKPRTYFGMEGQDHGSTEEGEHQPPEDSTRRPRGGRRSGGRTGK